VTAGRVHIGDVSRLQVCRIASQHCAGAAADETVRGSGSGVQPAVGKR
jgi:hypothetical protein